MNHSALSFYDRKIIHPDIRFEGSDFYFFQWKSENVMTNTNVMNS
jgi:hypothetical protein